MPEQIRTWPRLTLRPCAFRMSAKGQLLTSRRGQRYDRLAVDSGRGLTRRSPSSSKATMRHACSSIYWAWKCAMQDKLLSRGQVPNLFKNLLKIG
jgi:hypothetical protein